MPARAAAAATLAGWALSPTPPFAALFVVNRIALLNSRFGYAVGDQELRSRLTPADQIFRWSGPAFLALLNRPERIEKVRQHWRYVLPGKLERNFELSNRSVMLSISATWAVFTVAMPMDALVEQLDGFVTIQNPAQPS